MFPLSKSIINQILGRSLVIWGVVKATYPCVQSHRNFDKAPFCIYRDKGRENVVTI